jgi:small subunit ribosomal protein S14
MFINTNLKKKRKSFFYFEPKNKIIKTIIKNKAIKHSIRWYCNLIFSKKRQQTSKVKFKNKCVISGRSKSLYRFAKISRLFLRDNLYIGKIPGLRKSYW